MSEVGVVPRGPRLLRYDGRLLRTKSLLKVQARAALMPRRLNLLMLNVEEIVTARVCDDVLLELILLL